MESGPVYVGNKHQANRHLSSRVSRFLFHPTPINGLQIIQCQPIGDSRGYLERFFCQETFNSILHGRAIRQINRTLTQKKGTVRGLHFQYPPYAECKIVTCLKGQVWDVAVDLRRGSLTYLHHHAVLLSEDNHTSYLIPEGFAHGFQTLTAQCEMLYLHTTDYNAEAEGVLNSCDPRLAINWPEPITVRSDRDTCQALLIDEFHGIAL
jgi:dTDP-4-dehydrorhamnose 3,5-epimerase